MGVSAADVEALEMALLNGDADAACAILEQSNGPAIVGRRTRHGEPLWTLVLSSNLPAEELDARVRCFKALLEAGQRVTQRDQKGLSLLDELRFYDPAFAQALLDRPRGVMRVKAQWGTLSTSTQGWWERQIALKQQACLDQRLPPSSDRPRPKSRF